MKHAIDTRLRCLVLVVLSPVLVLIGVAVVMDSGLPVFLGQSQVIRQFGRPHI